MVWQMTVQNNYSTACVAPDPSLIYDGNLQGIVTVPGLGTIYMTDIGFQGGSLWGVTISSGSNSGTWTYPGQGALTITINSDGSFTASGIGSSLGPWPVAGTALPTFSLPASSTVYATAFTNAAYLQRLNLIVNSGPAMQWTGTGESNSELANTSFSTPSATGSLTAAVAVASSSNNGTSWTPSTISTPGTFNVVSYNQVTVVSEDGADDDYNDCALVLSWWVAPS